MHDVSVRQITLARLDAIVMAFLVTFLQSTIKISSRRKIYMFTMGISGVLIPLVIMLVNRTTFEDMKQNYVYLILVPLGFAFCMPLISELKTAYKTPGFLSKFIEQLSIYSYSIYLSHIYILFTVYYLMDKVRNQVPMGNLISKMVALVATWFISFFIFKYFESPLTARRPKELKREGEKS